MYQVMRRLAIRRIAFHRKSYFATPTYEVVGLPTRLTRCFSSTLCYASNPQIWSNDPDVESYGSCLAAEREDPSAFKDAASRLRKRSDLPADLRASAGRAQARTLFQEASALCESLKIDLDQPWPESAHREALLSVKRASDLYAEVWKESVDPELTAIVIPHCAEWPAAVLATETACREVRKLEHAIRMLEIRWLTVQIDRARALAHADRQGNESSKVQNARKLHAVGLPDVGEKELLCRAIKISEDVAGIFADQSDDLGHAEEWKTLRSKAQVLLIVQLKELALACACSSEIMEAGKHVTQALTIVPDIESTLAADAADHLKEVAQAIWEHSTRSMQSGATVSQAEEVMRLSTQIGSALVQFNARRFAIES